jgi:glycosyltransferase involved in cell wall biosynthesis
MNMNTENLDITVVITSCGRQDLLQETLRSIEQYSNNGITECIIVEDGPADNNFAKDVAPSIPKWTFLNSPVERRGQLLNIEWAYSHVQTRYIFHCEDDWRFTKPNFLQDSWRLLEAYPDCLLVHLRSHQDQWQQSHNRSWIEDEVYTLVDSYGSLDYWKTRPWIDKDGGFGFTFNPGLRRLSDYERVGKLTTPVAKRYGPFFNKKDGCFIERTNAENFQKLGMWCASLEPEGRVEHIGWHRHIPT